MVQDRETLFASLPARQAADGSWRTNEALGPVYSTVSWLTVMQLDGAELQIYRR